MKQTIIEDVSEILNIFNLDEITQLLHKQINTNSSFGENRSDHFKPIFVEYNSIMEEESNTGEVKDEAQNRFNAICNIFIDLICNKFHLELDPEWKDDHMNELPGVVIALYDFFVVDIVNNLNEVLVTYIRNNMETIYEKFEDRKNKKDAATLTNKKQFSPELAIVASNIYDITTWILQQMSEEQYIECMNPEYGPLKIFSNMLENGIANGEFMQEINDMYASDLSLKSDVCFQILSLIKTGRF